MLKEKQFVVGDETYTVRELTIGQMMPLMERLQGDEATKAQMDMVALSVHDSSGPLSDRVSDLGFSAYMELSRYVMSVNGIDAGEGNE